jgi:hypothetical protein
LIAFNWLGDRSKLGSACCELAVEVALCDAFALACCPDSDFKRAKPRTNISDMTPIATPFLFCSSQPFITNRSELLAFTAPRGSRTDLAAALDRPGKLVWPSLLLAAMRFLFARPSFIGDGGAFESPIFRSGQPIFWSATTYLSVACGLVSRDIRYTGGGFPFDSQSFALSLYGIVGNLF